MDIISLPPSSLFFRFFGFFFLLAGIGALFDWMGFVLVVITVFFNDDVRSKNDFFYSTKSCFGRR